MLFFFSSKYQTMQKNTTDKNQAHRRETAHGTASTPTGTLSGLPVEVWGLIVDLCPRDDTPSLSAACAVLRIYALERLQRRRAMTRDSVDAFVTKWQKETAECDEWSKDLCCSVCLYGAVFLPL